MGKPIRIKLELIHAVHIMNLLYSIEKAYKEDPENNTFIKKISLDSIEAYHENMRVKLTEDRLEKFIEDFEEKKIMHNELIKLLDI